MSRQSQSIETHRAIASAAVRVVRRKAPGTALAIAAEVGVSLRTVCNYFRRRAMPSSASIRTSPTHGRTTAGTTRERYAIASTGLRRDRTRCRTVGAAGPS
jgi:predicted transcriptional regulator